MKNRLTFCVLLAASLPHAIAAAQSHTPTLFVGNLDSGDVSVFTIAKDGGLSPVAGSPFDSNSQLQAIAMALNTDGSLLSMLHGNGAKIHYFSVAASGALNELPDSPMVISGANGGGSAGIAVARQGQREFLYIVRNGVYGFEIVGKAGAQSLVAVSGSPFPAPNGIPFQPIATIDGKYLYIPDYAGILSAFSIAADGALTALPGSPFWIGGNLLDLAVSGDGQHLYVAHGHDDQILGFAINDNDSLAILPGSPYFTGSNLDHPNELVVSADGQFVVFTDVLNDTVNVMTRTADGSLSIAPGGESFIDPNVNGVACDGGHVFVADGGYFPQNPGSMGIVSFDVAAAGGLTPLLAQPISAGMTPMHLALWLPPVPTPGDVDGNGTVNIDDLFAVIAAWGPCADPPAQCPADLDHDGGVDIDDLFAVIANWF